MYCMYCMYCIKTPPSILKLCIKPICIDIDWNDQNRHKKKINSKQKSLGAAKRAQSTMSSQKAKVDMEADIALEQQQKNFGAKRAQSTMSSKSTMSALAKDMEQQQTNFGFGPRKMSNAKRGSILRQHARVFPIVGLGGHALVPEVGI
jgi:hypothetical protein